MYLWLLLLWSWLGKNLNIRENILHFVKILLEFRWAYEYRLIFVRVLNFFNNGRLRLWLLKILWIWHLKKILHIFNLFIKLLEEFAVSHLEGVNSLRVFILLEVIKLEFIFNLFTNLDFDRVKFPFMILIHFIFNLAVLYNCGVILLLECIILCSQL
jgi:hypothetical protein